MEPGKRIWFVGQPRLCHHGAVADPVPAPRLDLSVDLVPDQSTDDTDLGWGASSAAESDADKLRRYLVDKPPHHGP